MRFLFAAVVMTFVLVNNCFGGFSYSLRLDQASYTVAPNTVITSGVWLYETPTAPDTTATSLFNSAQSVGFNVTTLPGGASTVLTAANFNGAFNLVNSVTPISGGFTVINSAITPVPATVFGGEKRINVGSVTFNSGASLGTTQIAFTDPSPGGFSNVTLLFGPGSPGTAADMDSVVFAGSSPISVTAVPEPSSMALVAVVGAGLFAARRRRKLSK